MGFYTATQKHLPENTHQIRIRTLLEAVFEGFMLARLHSVALVGIEGIACEIEVYGKFCQLLLLTGRLKVYLVLYFACVMLTLFSSLIDCY